MSISRVLVMTGGTRGFGRHMVERLLNERPEWHVILLARPSEHLDALVSAAFAAGRLTVVDADLSRLASVDNAIGTVRQQLDGRKIDAIALNAGIQVVDGDRVSPDGIELSFAVNHLSHFHIAESLAPHVRDGGRMVFTSSVVHDPKAFCLLGITRATWQPVELLADGKRSQTHIPAGVDRGEARYSASKLLNLMTVRHLAASNPRFSTFAFNPDVVPGTDIARERNALQILGWKYLMPLLVPILPGARSVERSGGDLLWLVTEADAKLHRGQYVNGRRIEPGSDESRDPKKIQETVEVSRAFIARILAARTTSPSAIENDAA
jgi:NAD(P)-dependent dehydrogenase (short-subunit alcohol dehydrogenase family)